MTLTTQDPDIDAATFRNAVAAVFKRLRRRYGRSVEYFGMVEFTSGQGTHSGGRRRIHQHILLKGLPAHADVLDVERDVRETWPNLQPAQPVSKSPSSAHPAAPSATSPSTTRNPSKPHPPTGTAWSNATPSVTSTGRSPSSANKPAANSKSKRSPGQQVCLSSLRASRSRSAAGKGEPVEEHPDRTVIAPLFESDGAAPPTESDWLMRRGRFVHRAYG